MPRTRCDARRRVGPRAVMVFPWLFTLYMSTQDWKVTGGSSFTGLANYVHLFTDDRFRWAVIRTLYFTAFATLGPVVLGVLSTAYSRFIGELASVSLRRLA